MPVSTGRTLNFLKAFQHGKIRFLRSCRFCGLVRGRERIHSHTVVRNVTFHHKFDLYEAQPLPLIGLFFFGPNVATPFTRLLSQNSEASLFSENTGIFLLTVRFRIVIIASS